MQSQTRWGIAGAFLAYTFTSDLPPAHTLAAPTAAAANAAASGALPDPLLWGIAAGVPPLLSGLELPVAAITPIGWGVPVAPVAAALFALRMVMFRVVHIPSPLWDRITHQAIVRRESAADMVRPTRASEPFTGSPRAPRVAHAGASHAHQTFRSAISARASRVAQAGASCVLPESAAVGPGQECVRTHTGAPAHAPAALCRYTLTPTLLQL